MCRDCELEWGRVQGLYTRMVLAQPALGAFEVSSVLERLWSRYGELKEERMSMSDFLALFAHLDPELKAGLSRLAGEALRSGNAGLFLRRRLRTVIVPETWHWEFLGLEPGASKAEIMKAARAMVAVLHPDKREGDARFLRLLERAREEALAEIGDRA